MTPFKNSELVGSRILRSGTLLGLLLTGASALLARPGHAQQLELTLEPLPPAPRLGDDSIVIEMAEAVRRDMDVLDARSSDDMIIDCITKAMRNYRRITFTLLALAGKDPGAHHLAVTGIRLGELAPSVDRTLAFLGSRPPARATGEALPPNDIASCLTLLDRFNARGTRLFDRVDVRDPLQLDAALELTMEPLMESLMLIEGTVIIDPWPTSTVAPALPADEISRCSRWSQPSGVRRARLLDQIEESVATISERSEDDLLALTGAVRLQEAIAGAEWLKDEIRDSLMLQFHDVLLDMVDGKNRGAARLRLKLLGSLATLLLHTNDLDSIDSRSRSRRRDIDEVMRTDITSLTEEDLKGRIRRLGKAAEAVSIATEVRRLQRIQPERYLLPTRRILDQDYQRAEQDVFKRILELVTTDGAMMDPDLAGLVTRQRELAADLELLRESRSWTDLATDVAPKDLKRFKGVIEGFARDLTRPSRRLAARRALGQMARQFGLILAPPFVERLDGTDLEAISLMGGRDREIMAVLESARIELLQDWLDGSPDGEGARRCTVLIRLLTLAEAFSSLKNFGGTDRLRGWGGWHLAEGGGVVDVSALAARLKVSATAIVRNDIDAATRQLDKLDQEIPAAKLAMALTSRPDALSEGERAQLGSLRSPSGADLMVNAETCLIWLGTTGNWGSNRCRSRTREELRAYCAALAELIAEDLSRGSDGSANGRPGSGTLQKR